MNFKKIVIIISASALLLSTSLKAETESECFEKVSSHVHMSFGDLGRTDLLYVMLL